MTSFRDPLFNYLSHSVLIITFFFTGLYGSEGILPAHLYLGGVQSSVGDCLKEHQTLVCLAPRLGLSIQHGMETVAVIGIILATLGLVAPLQLHH